MSGKTYIVTGASSGIGYAVTQCLLDLGFYVIALAGRGDKASVRTAQEAEKKLQLHYCDLSRFGELDRKFSEILRHAADIDGVVLCHGYGAFGAIEQFSAKQIADLIDLNLTSNLLICRQIVPVLKKRKRGDIVVIGSEAGLKGGRNGAVYCAAKFGLNGFVQALRQECAASDVRVSVVNPGMVKTPFFDSLDFSPGEDRENYLLPEDVANAVSLILRMPKGSVVDEVNLSPQKKVIAGKKRD